MSLLILLVLLLAVAGLIYKIATNKNLTSNNMKRKFQDIDVKVAYDFIFGDKKQYMSKLDDFVVIDVRSVREYKRGHIKGAINLNAMDLNFIKQLKKLDKHQRYIICGERESRSKRAVDIMKNRGFTEIYHMMGGMIEWGLMDYPVERDRDRFN